MKIVTQFEHDQLTPSGLMVHDHHPADPDRQTTVAACVGSIFAQLRQDEPGGPSTPTPRSASWVPASTRNRVVLGRSRAADERLDTFADARQRFR